MIYRIVKYIYRKTLFKLSNNIKRRKKIRNVGEKNITIISSNCLAGCIYSDLGKEFLSPTINTFFYAECFIKFCENLNYYLSLELIMTESSKYANDISYPVGLLGDVEIHFLHYSDFTDAYNKWNRRKEKVNYENIKFIMTDRDGFNENIAKRFSTLNGEGNIIFTAKKYNYDCEVYCKYERDVISSDFTSFRKYERYINIVEWFNS